VTRAVILSALAGLLLLAVAAPASAAARKREYAFEITSVSLTETMSFQGDGGPACARAGVCGYKGTVTYSFSGGDGLAAFRLSGNHVDATGDFFYEGLTSASVQGPGGGPPCTDKVLKNFDGFEVQGHPNAMRLVFHPAIDTPDYLDTICTGPSDLDITHAGALPTITISERTLRRKKFTLGVSSTRPFHAGPFVGTLSFSTTMRFRRSRDLSDIFFFLAPDL
jgi:hypothetical protein